MSREAARGLLDSGLPTNPDWLDLTNYASALFLAEQDEEAIKFAYRAITLERNSTTLLNTAVILESFGQFDDACALFAEAHVADPTNVRLGAAYADSLLRLGRWQEGWPLYSRYHNSPAMAPPPTLGQAAGRRIIVVGGGGGVGDEIYHLRWLSRLHSVGCHITYVCPSAVAPLVRNHPWIDRIIPRSSDIKDIAWAASGERMRVEDGIFHLSLGEMDFVVSSLSLAHLVDARLASDVWPGEPYIRLPMRHRLHVPRAVRSLRIGFNWKAGEWNFPRAHRSLRPSQVARIILSRPLQQWHSLTYDEPPAFDFARPKLRDWLDTAKVIDSMDLVVTVDTGVAHLSGAMGKPTWVVLPGNSAWQYLTTTETIPLYPSMRLFRNSGPGNDDAVNRLVVALESL
jgi:tetratricopeptide (TPR) repeat protein